MAVATLMAPYARVSGKTAAPGGQAAATAVVAMPDKNGRTLMRQYVVPNNPNTTFQSIVRATFTSVSEAFQSLSLSEVEAWQALAQSIVTSGRLGLTYKLTWNQLFQQVNNYRLQDGQSIVYTAPSLGGANIPTGIIEVISDDGSPDQALTITLSDSSPSSPSKCAFRFTRNLGSPNRKARDNDFQYVTTSALSILPRDTSAPYEYSITSTRLNIQPSMYIGVEVTVLNADYVPVGRIVNTNILVGTP